MVKVSAGSYDLNKWLFGGYESDIITTIYGSSGSGKTTFCLLAAVSQAKKGGKVIYIDTEGGFSTERIKQLSGDSSKEILERIFVLQPTSFSEQKDAFRELLKRLNDEITLIVVDGMTMLYRLEFADAREKSQDAMQDINSELARQMRVLAEVARRREIPVLVTNQVYSWDNSQRMVGGDILKYWSKCLIEVSNDNGRRVAYLRKHRSLPEKELLFQIVNEGVRKKGWL